jgi:hypothetical protein
MWVESKKGAKQVGTRDPHLADDMSACGRGSGLRLDGMLKVFGYPDQGNLSSTRLQYFLIRGTAYPSEEVKSFVFYASGKKAGYPADDSVRDEVYSFYEELVGSDG